MSISLPEFKRRYAAIRELMKKEDIDCILVAGLSDDFNRGNIRYLTGYGRGGCCLFPLEGRPVYLVAPHQSVSPKMRKMLEAFDLLDLRETSDPAVWLKKEMPGFVHSGRLGIAGMSCISIPVYLAIVDKIQDRWLDASGILEQVRIIKSPEEIDKIRIAARVADAVYEDLKDYVHPGQKDFEIYGEVKKTIYEMGCEYSFDLIDAEGSRLNMTYWPTGERLKNKNTLFMEITPAFEGYYAQLPVTLPVWDYPPGIQKMIGVWEKANRAALEVLRPGTLVSDLYRVLIDTVRENGYVSPLRPGHAIGLEALDFWSITESNSTVLKPGMTLAVHPSIMTEMGGEGCGMGYTYLITDTGAERFSKVELGLS
jgi:Xaa-Pro aminopeptidase